MSPPPQSDADRARAEVPQEIEEFEGPETSPAIPAAAVAAHAAAPAAAAASGTADGRAVTNRAIWALAWPVILSQVLASAVSIIDIAMLGRLGKDAIAAVGYATQYLWLAQSILFAIGIACVALMARAVGAERPDRARHALAASLAVAVALGVVFSVASVLAPATLMGWLGASPDIVEAGTAYFQLTLGATLLLSVTITLESGFRAIKDTRTPMRIALVVTAVKTLLNYVLIFGAFGLPRLDLVGAGTATVVAQVVGLVLFALAGRRARGPVPIRISASDLREARPIYREVIRISLPAVAERIVMNVAMMSYFALLGGYGSEALAAYTIGVRLLSFSWIPGVGFSVAASTLVGQSLGAYDPEGAGRAAMRSLRFSFGIAVLLGFAFLALRDPLMRAFTNDPDVLEALGSFIVVLAIAQPLLGIHFTLGGALRGAGDTVNPLVAAAIGNWIFRVPLAVLVSRVLELDLVWIWITLSFDHLARVLWLGWHFRRGRWKRRLGLSPG